MWNSRWTRLSPTLISWSGYVTSTYILRDFNGGTGTPYPYHYVGNTHISCRTHLNTDMCSKMVYFLQNAKWTTKIGGIQTCLMMFKWALMMSMLSKLMFLLYICIYTSVLWYVCVLITECSLCMSVHFAYTPSYTGMGFFLLLWADDTSWPVGWVPGLINVMPTLKTYNLWEGIFEATECVGVEVQDFSRARIHNEQRCGRNSGAIMNGT